MALVGRQPVRVLRFVGAVVLLLSLVLAASAASPSPSVAQQGGPRILHLPMRWCVLEGTTAARRGANAAVLERLRRGSSILAPQVGITLRSALNRTLAGKGAFPVIRDPRPGVGRRGDVVVPTISTGEYRLVVDRCAQAWRRLESRLAPDTGLGGVARGPIAVIIGDFVDTAGRRYSSVWGYGFSVTASGALCDAGAPSTRHASGGSLLVVDSADGHPSATLDRRLIAHEVGHILRLGHGNGLDDPGSIQGRIDKFCDDGENPAGSPGSLMWASLSSETVRPWQRRLPRSVATRHAAVIEDHPVVRLRPQRRALLERLANGGSRVVKRRLPPGHSPMTPLPRLTGTGVRGAEANDALRDTGSRQATTSSDLRAFGVSEDLESGEVDVWYESVGAAGGPIDASEFRGAIDADGDPGTGGDPAAIPGLAEVAWKGLAGVDMVSLIRLADGALSGEAWRWDAAASTWLSLSPAPVVRFADSFGEYDDATVARSAVMSLLPGAIELADRFQMAGQLRTVLPSGRVLIDALPAKRGSGEMVSMSLEAADYPVCAVNRGATFPGVGDPGGVITLETFGFGGDGPVSIWLADGKTPVATGDYWEIPDDPWPWVAEVPIPEDIETGLHMIQVVFKGTGLTAECPVMVGGDEGDAELLEFDR